MTTPTTSAAAVKRSRGRRAGRASIVTSVAKTRAVAAALMTISQPKRGYGLARVLTTIAPSTTAIGSVSRGRTKRSGRQQHGDQPADDEARASARA